MGRTWVLELGFSWALVWREVASREVASRQGVSFRASAFGVTLFIVPKLGRSRQYVQSFLQDQTDTRSPNVYLDWVAAVGFVRFCSSKFDPNPPFDRPV